MTSAPNKTPFIELYTSEGCDSCPPADRWLSANFARDSGVDANKAIAVAFHVDYWDRLGWTDRFASHAYTERQYAAMQANGKTFVVTPQILLQGHEFPGNRSKPKRALDDVAQEPAAATIELTATNSGNEVAISASTQIKDAATRAKTALAIAYVDSGLVSDVKAGENKGARLTHDHVVRALKSAPPGSDSLRATFAVPAERGVAPTVVAFVQNIATNDVLQAVALPLADCMPRR